MPRRARPVERLSCARRRTIEQKGFHSHKSLITAASQSGGDRNAFHTRRSAGISSGRFVAMKLHDIETCLVGIVATPGSSTNTPTFNHMQARAISAAASGRNVSRTFRIEVEAERGSSGIDCGKRIFPIRDAADLDHHAVRLQSACTWRSGSHQVFADQEMRESRRPAIRSICARFSMPLSLTLMRSAGIRRASRSEVSRRTSKRVQIAIIHADDLGAGFERRIEFGVVMDFNERCDAELRRRVRGSAHLLGRENRGDKKDRVGAVRRQPPPRDIR